MTPWEESQVIALERAAFVCMIDAVLEPTRMLFNGTPVGLG
jgi:hypothetical protein